MRILITTSTFPFKTGDGQARFVLDLAKALSSTTKVTVLAPHAPGAAPQARIGDVDVRRFRYFIPSQLERLSYGAGMRHNIEHSWLARIQIPFLVLAQLLATMWLVLTRRVSVVNPHWLVPQGLTAAIVARITGVPLVLHVHAADVYFLRRFRFGRAVARFVVRSCSSVLADGSHVRDSLDELLGFDSGAHLRPMGVWLEVFGAKEPPSPNLVSLPDRFVLFVGRLVEKKGVEYLIRAMALVREEIPDIELVVVGSGPLSDELAELAEHWELSEVVHFLGALEHDGVAALLGMADIACVPSIIDSHGETEGMPTVVLEAMASGARVVGTRVNGIPDVLHDAQNGWLVEPADDQALAAGLIAAANGLDAELIAEEGARTAAQHDWDAVANEYRKLLEEAVRG